MPTENYPDLVLRESRRLKSLAEAALAQVSDEQFFAEPGPGDNSLAVIVKHLGGNLASRWTDFLTSDGEKPSRDRDREFEIGPGDTREQLMKSWTHGWEALLNTLAALTEADLERTVTIRREPITVLQALNRGLIHNSYHTGQIVYVAKHHCGPAWRSLSIPRGGSAAFNQQPARYVTSA